MALSDSPDGTYSLGGNGLDQIITMGGGDLPGGFPPYDPNAGSGGVTYKQYVSPDGPFGSTYPAGTLYSVGSNGSVSVDYTPPKGGSGGSTSPTNVYISQNPGQLYTTITSDGSDGFPAGTVYQKNMVTGDFNVLYKPSVSAGVNPADKNNDGLDDTTNMALGVYKYAGSPTGYAYGNGQPVWPNGAPYEGGTTGGSDLDLSNKISTGGVTYVWSNKEQKYVPAPGLPLSSGPGSTPTSGGTYSASGSSSARAILSSGGGGSTAASRDYAAEAEQQGQIQERLIRLQNALKNDPNNPYLIMEQQQLALQAQQIANSQRNADAQLRRQNILDFESAVSDTDMAKLNARRLALGANGDVSIANLLRDTPDGFQANDAAAALLAEIRGQGQMTPVGGVAGAFGISGASGGTTGTTPTGAATATGTAPGTTTATGTQQTTIGGPIDPYLYDPTTGQRLGMNPAYVVEQGKLRQQEAAQAEWAKRTGWYPVSGPAGIVYTEYANGAPTGKTMSQAEYGTYQQNNDPQSFLSKFYEGVSVSGGYGGALSKNLVIKPKTYDELGQASGTDSQTLIPWAAGYQLPGAKPAATPGEMPYGNDNIQRPLPPTSPQAVVPMVAHGTDRPMMGPIVTGDPQVPGRPNPELTVWTPQGNIVRPLNQMHPMMRPVTDMMPHAAFGTFNPLYSSPVYQFFHPTSGTTAGSTTPVATTTPSTTSSSPVSPSASPAPAPAPVPPQQPVTQPATNTQPQQPVMQPVTQPQPTTTGGIPVTTTQTPNPADPLSLTPQATQYINDVADFRNTFWRPTANQLDISFNRTAPSFQRSVQQGEQTASGMPIEDQQWYRQRYAFTGRPTMASIQGW